ncbi:uncharacterized protein K452DRAFT_230998, partial [Aplosporella prunicola CBS 121167]
MSARAASILSSKRFTIERILPDRIDYNILNNWIEYCEDNHTGCQSMVGNAVIPNLKLIDCTSMQIIGAEPHHKYATLSYVWGSSVQDDSKATLFSGLSQLPQVIQDSINIAKRLNIQYLWVDRYCIPQDDRAEKHKQIINMHLIYANAVVTFIASAGENPSYGLPGAPGSRKRRAQSAVRVGNQQFTSTGGAPTFLLRRSKWWKRAWTYQEALLSRRCLVFTDDKVLFQC